MSIFNAHVHLNGSISLNFLEETSNRNNCYEIYQKFILESDVWKKFYLIHQIIQTPEDIKLATLDVVQNSEADFLEIRTTPKHLNGYSIDEYIESFVNGLIESNTLFPQRRTRGLLSIDRSRHSLENAKWIIDVSVNEKKKSGMIVGVDLSGNFNGKRSLTGKELYEAIKYGLHKEEIGVALHVGEIDSKEEEEDFDIILECIQNEYKGKKVYGKIRLGHAIYRTKKQDEIIKKLKIPIEICPSCHLFAGWWKKGENHPVQTLYQFRKQVIPGTDDSLLFDCKEIEEQKKLDSIMKVNEKDLSLNEKEQEEKLSMKRKRYLFS